MPRRYEINQRVEEFLVQWDSDAGRTTGGAVVLIAWNDGAWAVEFNSDGAAGCFGVC